MPRQDIYQWECSICHIVVEGTAARPKGWQYASIKKQHRVIPKDICTKCLKEARIEDLFKD
jgi:hypothetical protein